MKTTLQATAVVLATTAGLLTTVAVPTASAATTCASPVFKRQLFANTTFKGTPKKTACDSAIDESWSGAPASGLPKDNFGVRWSVTRDFGSGGPFALAASGLDGIRVYLDGVRKIDLWKNTTKTVTKTVNATSRPASTRCGSTTSTGPAPPRSSSPTHRAPRPGSTRSGRSPRWPRWCPTTATPTRQS
ncbi:PA14 domain-containing protein [Streptomyces sp. 900105755]